MITISPSPKAKRPLTINTTVNATAADTNSNSSSSSSFGFWSLNSTSLSSSSSNSTFFYKKKAPISTKAKPIIMSPPKPKKKKVTFVTQCHVKTFEVVSINEDFENTCEDDEDYWEQLGEDYWYQAHDFAAFKKDRRTLVDRIRTIGLARAKGNYCMEGLEFFLTLKAREVHKERVLDGWVSVLEVQADFDKDSDDDCCTQETKVELIAAKYAHVSKECQQDATQRAVETAQEIKAEDDKIVASIPKSPQPKKGSIGIGGMQKEATKVKALVWGNFSTSTSSNNNNSNTVTSFSTFQKIRPFPRQ